MAENEREKEFLKHLWATFKVEAEEHLSFISSGLLELEKGLPTDRQNVVIENIYRRSHSLKGSSRAVDFTSIESICQSLESIFKNFKYQNIPDSPEVFDILQRSVDIMESILSGQYETNINPILIQLELIKSGDFDTVISTTKQQFSQPVQKKAEALPDKIGGRFGQQGIKSKTAHSSEIIESKPEEPSQIKSINPLPKQKESPSTIRVDSGKLDRILLQAEEMIFMKHAVSHRLAELKELNPVFRDLKKKKTAILSHLKLLRKISSKYETQGDEFIKYIDTVHTRIRQLQSSLNHISRSLNADYRVFSGMVNAHQEDIRKTLMLPFSTLTESFPRMVRDLARQNSKDIELEIKGNQIEIDKRILEEIKDPLVHLLRNAIDHGIEFPQERQKKGKPTKGIISLNISQKESNKIEIALSDDGSGVMIQKVKEKALSLGIFTREDLERSSQQDILSLIFDSEFSTSPIITDISGRGLGLAIVREKVEKLGGRLDIQSQEGKGTTFYINLQATMATFRGITIETAGWKFIIPTLNVEKVLQIHPDEIKTVENRETIQYGDILLSLVQLSQVLSIPNINNTPQSHDKVNVVVLGVGERRVAFQVDRVTNEEEVLLKDLGKQLQRVKNISGATISGSGEVIPVLNSIDLIKSAISSAAGLRKSVTIKQENHTQTPHKSILVVEDSITSRILLKNILESAGFEVEVAVDGMDGWLTVKEKKFDLAVLDIEMPGMNGFQLTQKIRSDKNLGQLPIILVTALESREDREKGIDVGADAYIVKSSFDQSNLLDVIKKLI